MFCLHIDFKVSQSHQEDMENFKSQLEEQHAQEVEHLRSYYHQQLKETEERCTLEIAHLQGRLQDARDSSEYLRYFWVFLPISVHNEGCNQGPSRALGVQVKKYVFLTILLSARRIGIECASTS